MADIFSYPITEARQTGRNIVRENAQFESRWNVITYHWPIPEAERDPALRPCARCCAHWYHSSAETEATHFAAHAARPIVAVQRVERSVASFSRPAASSIQPPVALPAAQQQELWSRLTDLMRWQAEGRLSGAEFAAAKALLGL
eukprot:3256200-Lingulodinium_polyedra.AAC.1